MGAQFGAWKRPQTPAPILPRNILDAPLPPANVGPQAPIKQPPSL